MLTVLTLKQTGEVKKYIGEWNGKPVHVSEWAYTGRIRLSEVKGYDLSFNPLKSGQLFQMERDGGS